MGSYDGASNMSGCKAGLQTLVRELQPLAPYTVCPAHSGSLANKDVIKEFPLLTNMLGIVGESSKLIGKSAKRLEMHKSIQSNLRTTISEWNTGASENYIDPAPEEWHFDVDRNTPSSSTIRYL
jgi:hypothetical protein